MSTVSNERVLLTGEVNNEAVKAQAGTVAAASKDVRTVNNELVIAAPSSFGDRTEDNTLGNTRARERSSIRARLRSTRSTSSLSGARFI